MVDLRPRNSVEPATRMDVNKTARAALVASASAAEVATADAGSALPHGAVGNICATRVHCSLPPSPTDDTVVQRHVLWNSCIGRIVHHFQRAQVGLLKQMANPFNDIDVEIVKLDIIAVPWYGQAIPGRAWSWETRPERYPCPQDPSLSVSTSSNPQCVRWTDGTLAIVSVVP